MPPVPREFLPPFSVSEPAAWRYPFIFNVPHANSCYPASFRDQSQLDAHTLRRAEDAFVDELFADAAASGAPMMAARFPRAYLDLNREPYELDPQMFKERLPPYANTRSMRVAGGLGAIPRIVAEGSEIYAGKLDVGEALERIELLHEPYHRALRRLLTQALRRFGAAFLIDCHSMPSSSVVKAGIPDTDIVLGDRHGLSCAPQLTAAIETGFRARGYRVARNNPYAGGFNTQHYGSPAKHVHALQIELNRKLYMNEETIERIPEKMRRVSADIDAVLGSCMKAFSAAAPPSGIAAE